MIAFDIRADRLDVFDPMEDNRLSNSREMKDWLWEHFGLPMKEWEDPNWRYYLDTMYEHHMVKAGWNREEKLKILTVGRSFVFNHEKDAVLFKLRWI